MELLNEHYIGQGRQKVVYRHPCDPNLCIKIPKAKPRLLKSLKREIKYLKRHQQKLQFLADYLGEIETNLGKGYLFSLICDHDGAVSKPLESIYSELDGLGEKVASMYQSLLKNKSAVSELEPCNILVKRWENGEYELYIIDGFGNSDFIKVCDFSRTFLKKKLTRKFRGLCELLDLPQSFLD